MAGVTICRLRVVVEPLPGGADGWCATYVPVQPDGIDLAPLPAGWPAARTLGVQSAGERVFPRLPPDTAWNPPANLPAGVAPRLADYCTGANPAGLADLYERLIDRRPVAENYDVSTFGRYLFETLLGPEVWSAARAWATSPSADILEVALAWSPHELHLHRLNWELMHGPESFLAARQPDPPHTVVITRMVQGARHAPAPVQEVPRYLFVIGAPASDPGIRPATEFLGLLLGVKEPAQSIYPMVLQGERRQGANSAEVQGAVRAFRPHIVHFTCHGKFDEARPTLTLQPDPKAVPPTRDFDAAAIHTLLSPAPPQVVVLSACNTGQAAEASPAAPLPRLGLKGSHETAPMAAGLVHAGIPVVVGMAGQVADSACRHFTRCFGQAIVARQPLLSAVAEGRWAAFAYGQAVEASVDWAFPALFVAEVVPPSFTPVEAGDQTDYARVESIIRGYNLRPSTEEPYVFCGRDDFFDAFRHLFDEGRPAVLAAYVKEGSGYGKSRLLQELAMAAIRDGHVPVAFIHNEGVRSYPHNVPDLARALVDEFERVRGIYAAPGGGAPLPAFILPDLIPGPGGGALDWQAPALAPYPDLAARLRNSRGQLTATVLAAALANDLLALADYARRQQPFVAARRGRPLLLLDDVHLFADDFIDSWFSGKVLGRDGLGPDAARRIPVVMSLSVSDTGGQPATQILRPLIEKRVASAWLALLPLEPFPTELDQDLLLYEQVWLNPFNARLVPGASDLPLAWAAAPDPERLPLAWLRGLRRAARFPGQLTHEAFYDWAAEGLDKGTLMRADDRQKLDEYIDRMKAQHAGG